MKGAQTPVSLNELFGGLLEGRAAPIMLLLLSVIQCYFRLEAEPPNARIKLPDINMERHPS
jgi:hypothetical protein